MKPLGQSTKGKGREYAELTQQWDQLLLKDDVLYRQFKDTTGIQHPQAVVPKVNQSDILHQLHDGELRSHLGQAMTFSQLRERFYYSLSMQMTYRCGVKIVRIVQLGRAQPSNAKQHSKESSRVPVGNGGSLYHCMDHSQDGVRVVMRMYWWFQIISPDG